MTKQFIKRPSATLSLLLLTGILSAGAFAQQNPGTSGTSDANQGNTMSGGSEAKPTDQATPGGMQSSGQSGTAGTSGTSDPNKGNMMTGGSEGQQTDQATPGTSGASSSGASPSSGDTSGAGTSGNKQ
jgi:hypothetical protein